MYAPERNQKVEFLFNQQQKICLKQYSCQTCPNPKRCHFLTLQYFKV